MTSYDISRSIPSFCAGQPARAVRQGFDSGADAVIIDLEDAVAPDEKVRAREALIAWLNPERPAIVRINAAETPWFHDDCALAHLAGVSGVMLPKAERIDEIALLSRGGAGTPVLPIIESASGFDNIQAIARAPGVQRLVFGSIDFQLDLGISGEELELLMFRSGIVLASRLAGLQAPVDGVSTAIDDAQALRADAERSRRLGFGAKLCIHPRQVGVVNAALSPTEREMAWAVRILEAAASSGGAAIAVDGRMVDRPVIARAQMIVNEVEHRGGRDLAAMTKES